MDNSDKQLKLLGGGIVLLLALYWFWRAVLLPHTWDSPPWTLLDSANLIFHEAGHFVFMFFGDFMHILGGSLMQLIIPAVALGTFIYQREQLSSGFALFWLGESSANLSYYIADARAMALPLIGGDSSGHDWNWLLTDMNLLNSDIAIGQAVYAIAVILMIGGLFWMVFSLYKTYNEQY